MNATFTVKLEAAASAAAVKAALESADLQSMVHAAKAGAADGAAFRAAYPGGDLSHSARRHVAKQALQARTGAEYIVHAEQYLDAFCLAAR